jgi:Flp pilus assembly secretin CpaC
LRRGASGSASGGGKPFGVALANLATRSLDVTLSALEEKGLIRRLAELDLVALSG